VSTFTAQLVCPGATERGCHCLMNENSPWANVWITFCLFIHQKRWKTNASGIGLEFTRVQFIHLRITIDTSNFLLPCLQSVLRADSTTLPKMYTNRYRTPTNPPRPPYISTHTSHSGITIETFELNYSQLLPVS
jgi:hypothetical protein